MKEENVRKLILWVLVAAVLWMIIKFLGGFLPFLILVLTFAWLAGKLTAPSKKGPQ